MFTLVRACQPRVSATGAASVEEHARAALIQSDKDHHLPTIYFHPIARGAWLALAAEFRSRSQAWVMSLRRDQISIRIGRGETIPLHFNYGQGHVWDMFELGVVFDDGQLVTALLDGLPARFDTTTNILLTMGDVTLEAAQAQLPKCGAPIGAAAGT